MKQKTSSKRDTKIIQTSSKRKKMKNIDNLIEQTAVKAMKHKTVVKEFSFLLAIFIVLKLFTSLISIIAGYSYLHNVLLQITKNIYIAVFLSVIALFLIELITQTSLQRMFKFILKKQARFIWLMVSIVLIFFVLSSYISMQGISIIASRKKDLTAQIIAKYNLIEQATKKEYTDKINYQKDLISTIKKQTWRGKLSGQHVRQITDINNTILQIETEQRQKINEISDNRKQELKQNSFETQKTVTNYIWIVASIMLIQLLSNLFLNYFYLLILKEKNEYLNDFVNTEQTKIKSNIIDLYKEMFKFNSSAILSGLQRGIIETQSNIIIDKKGTAKELTGTKKMGFVIPDSNKNELEAIKKEVVKQHSQEPERQTHVKTPVKTPVYGTAICPNCGKEFEKHAYNHKYCSEFCRIEFYEKRTGKKLNNLKNLHKR